jgi:tRNA threonylcarbamoyladenosine biosynthesis protein TsaB
MTNVLGIDSSSIVTTIAVVNEEKLMSEYIVNNKKTHSEKMMVVLKKVLDDLGITVNDLDVIGVAKGPGSFTGIRIGMACAQGIAHVLNKPMVGVNTLDGLAYNLMGNKDLICPVINAQRQELYTSLYCYKDGELERLWEYKLIKADKLVKELSNLNKKVVTLGDGLPLLKKALVENDLSVENIVPAHPVFSMPRASSIAAVALKEYAQGNSQDCFSVKPFYIRKSNAEEKWEERHGAKS